MMAFERILKPIYENSFNLPHEVGHHTWPYGYPLLPSRVSTELVATATITLDKRYTYMLMQWVQFLDHNLDHMVPVLSTSHFSTRQSYSFVCINDPSCFPFVIPHTDTQGSMHHTCCSSPVYDISTTSLVMNSLESRLTGSRHSLMPLIFMGAQRRNPMFSDTTQSPGDS